MSNYPMSLVIGPACVNTGQQEKKEEIETGADVGWGHLYFADVCRRGRSRLVGVKRHVLQVNYNSQISQARRVRQSGDLPRWPVNFAYDRPSDRTTVAPVSTIFPYRPDPSKIARRRR